MSVEISVIDRLLELANLIQLVTIYFLIRLIDFATTLLIYRSLVWNAVGKFWYIELPLAIFLSASINNDSPEHGTAHQLNLESRFGDLMILDIILSTISAVFLISIYLVIKLLTAMAIKPQSRPYKGSIISLSFILLSLTYWSIGNLFYRPANDIYEVPGYPTAMNAPPFLFFQGDGATFALGKTFYYEIKATKKKIAVPAGFVTDFASVPALAQGLIPRLGPHSVAAIIHDYLYWDQSCTRLEADNIMVQIMKEYGSSWATRALVYRALRLGGGSSWQQNKIDREKGFVRVLPKSKLSLPPNATWSEFRAMLFVRGFRSQRPIALRKPDYCT